MVGFHGVINTNHTPAIRGPYYADERGRAVLINPGAVFDIGEEKLPKAPHPLPGEVTRVGPWPKIGRLDSLNDVVIVLGASEKRLADYFQTVLQGRRDKVARFMRWFISGEDAPPPDLSCQRIQEENGQENGPAAYYCRREEVTEIKITLRSKILKLLQAAIISGDNPKWSIRRSREPCSIN